MISDFNYDTIMVNKMNFLLLVCLIFIKKCQGAKKKGQICKKKLSSKTSLFHLNRQPEAFFNDSVYLVF